MPSMLFTIFSRLLKVKFTLNAGITIWNVLEFPEVLTPVRVAVVFAGPAERPGEPDTRLVEISGNVTFAG